ncbi:MAG TPA: hypothetical protein VFQ63_02690 [Patescibacteria group bacterium]|nr:hypothetical protein [Patescibacteria group bacterium]
MKQEELFVTINTGGENMGSFGGFYKGDKKKPKQNKKSASQTTGISAPVFVLPKMVDKKRKPE